MAKPTASLPQGTRDFGPDVVRKRQFIFNTIRKVFVLYGFEPLETPAWKILIPSWVSMAKRVIN
jgi:histidyl-tRNA synthetase